MRYESDLEAFRELKRQTPYGRSKLDQEVSLAHAWNFARDHFTNAQPAWIPVEERLPEVGDCYLTTQDIDDGEPPMTWPLHFDAGEKTWYDDIDRKEPFTGTVLAWMERPAPYQPQGQTGGSE